MSSTVILLHNKPTLPGLFKGNIQAILPNGLQSIGLALPDRSPAITLSHSCLLKSAIVISEHICSQFLIRLPTTVSIVASAANFAVAYFKYLVCSAEITTPDSLFPWYSSVTFTMRFAA